MPELRWTLLIVGIVFIAALAWWERRKPHQASRDKGESHAAGKEPQWTSSGDQPALRSVRDPDLVLPEMRARETGPPRELPIVEIGDDDSLIGLRVDGERVEEQVAAEEAIAEEPSVEPIVPTPVEEEPEVAPERPPPVKTASEPIVEWPAEEERKVIALRIVAAQPERFAGRPLRQALAAEGFVLGKLAIFHKTDAENRVVLSAASLTKPGTFDLDTMDTQRFGGLNLFAVLPGPKSPRRTFEDLLITARTLNERLQGALQDERGGPLTPTRIAAIRDGLEAEASP
jgi:cell division protein ZipA